MVGVPGETARDLELTFDLLRRNWFWGICFMIYHPYPETELYQQCIDQNLFVPPQNLVQWSNYDVYDWGNTIPNPLRHKIERFRDHSLPLILAKHQLRYYVFKNLRELIRLLCSKQLLTKLRLLIASLSGR